MVYPVAIPDGFQPCPKGVHCPSCKSKLIKKMPTEVTVSSIDPPGLDPPTNENDNTPSIDYAAIQTSLESARTANLLLQAMSFDAATRENNHDDDQQRPAPVSGVSYCPSCRVHVITDPCELTTLFDKVTNGDETAVESALRGRLYVCVSEDDVASLAHRKEMGEPACSYDIITPSSSNHKGNDFDYEFRHKIATKEMGRKITKGWKMTEVLCEECEMPCMINCNEEKECVVCPKLDAIRCKFTSGEGLPKFTLSMNPTEDSLFEIDEGDPVSLIIAEARRAIKGEHTPDASGCASGGVERAASAVSPGVCARSKVEEAKMFLQSKAKRDDKSKDGTAPLTLDPSNIENATSHPITTQGQVVDWDALLTTGRALFSQRIQEGWELSTDNCSGMHCKNTPLLSKEGEVPVCTVCSGSGTGMDGAYEAQKNEVKWEDLVSNGRVILTERLRQGWILSEENCNGVNCKGTPLTMAEDGTLSCVVCGGCGSGLDGAYAFLKSNNVVEAERALATQEISYLMSMGWMLRDSLCDKCDMPLVAQHVDSVDLCIMCGKNNPLNLMDNACFDENANEAAQRIQLGWRLGDASPLCATCGGVQMTPPNSMECGCINRACPMVLPEVLVSTPALPSMMPETSQAIKPHSHQGTGSEVLKKMTDKLSIGRLLKDGLVPLMVCGAPDYADDQSALSDDMSIIRSTTTNALGAILARLDQAKYQLEVLNAQRQYSTEEVVMKQGEIAMLIEKLANAAVAMKEMEQIEARDPPMCM
ncbi:hypothetical protein ACHAXN_011986 [Cyclotella atomus]